MYGNFEANSFNTRYTSFMSKGRLSSDAKKLREGGIASQPKKKIGQL